MPSEKTESTGVLEITERGKTAAFHGFLWLTVVSALSVLLDDSPAEAIAYGVFCAMLYGTIVYIWQPY
ncbi:hypothetical protein C464_16152 [Halorubrum coriense DSM 10284]|uniref:Uncharacterized protein n=1 Tax=Halorubrum coriense DSM 10284 TaxID=1227466 RepID=M0E9G2_9EURY|nr:hypothetical protein [Halorubrum coriense]ELZ43698.1 hypothetical protein C464_16152 [Halorubrum coriense DSM 10284]